MRRNMCGTAWAALRSCRGDSAYLDGCNISNNAQTAATFLRSASATSNVRVFSGDSSGGRNGSTNKSGSTGPLSGLFSTSSRSSCLIASNAAAAAFEAAISPCALPGLTSLRGFATQQPGKRESLRNSRQGGAASSSLRPIQPGIIHVMSTTNNTMLTLTDEQGATKAWASAGSMGFKNARKSTTYAAEAAAEKLGADALRLGFNMVQLKVRGLGQGKLAAVKALAGTGVMVSAIHECTPLPHNGCRPPKKRRV